MKKDKRKGLIVEQTEKRFMGVASEIFRRGKRASLVSLNVTNLVDNSKMEGDFLTTPF